MSTMTLQELAGDPKGFLHRMAAGEALLLTSDGAAIAEVRPLAARRAEPRPCGLAKGTFATPDDFDAPLPEEALDDFEGR